MKTFSFNQLFALLFVTFIGLLAATALQAWTGPTSAAPGGNAAAPLNVSINPQVKSGGLAVNGFLDSGTSLLTKLGINLPQNSLPVVALDVNGSVKLGNGGEPCQGVSEGAMHYNASTKRMEYCDGSSWKPFITRVLLASSPADGSTCNTACANKSASCGAAALVDQSFGNSGATVVRDVANCAYGGDGSNYVVQCLCYQ